MKADEDAFLKAYKADREQRYVLGEPKIMIERLKDGYTEMMQVAEMAQQHGFISSKFRAVYNQLIQEVYFKMKERLELNKTATI